LAVTPQTDEEVNVEKEEEQQEDPITNFMYALKAPETRRQWPRRLKIVFDFLDMSSNILEE
jgi:hypothetical protein